MAFSKLSTRSAAIVVAVLTACLIVLITQYSASSPYCTCHAGDHDRHDGQVLYRPSEWPGDHDHGPSTQLTSDFRFMNNRFLLNMSHEMDEKLKSRLRPKHFGMIWTAHNETLRLPMGISMFHAMHCLLMLRTALQAVLDGTSTSMSHDSSPIFNSAHAKNPLDHIPHCYSYVAQHVMCLSDSTIEPPWIDKDAAGNILAFGIDGIGVHHKCKDTSRMLEIARRAKTETFDPWEWKDGDTVESVFGSSNEL